MRLYILSLFIILLGCQSQPKEVKDANAAYYDSIKHLSGSEFDERLRDPDSLLFYFYDNPDGDANRYTRYYTEFATTDSISIRVVRQAAEKKFSRLETIKDCRSQGKVFLFADGKPRQTLYFSNRGDSCSHIYFIKDGWFYYMPMDSATGKLLSSLKTKAQKPAGESVPGD